MSEEKIRSNSHNKKRYNIVLEYVKKNILFVVILAIVFVACVLLAMKPAINFVHKVEAAMPMNSADVIADENGELVDLSQSDNLNYGDHIADITCEKRGINVSAYYGINRSSFRYGVGISGKSSIFSDDDKTVVAGYDETYFSALNCVKKGDVITVTLSDSTLKYKVVNTVIDNQTDPSVETKAGQLVMYSIYSDFSENSGKCFFVIADKIDEEVTE